MIFGRRRQHPLPKFPNTVIPAFRGLCREIPLEQIDEVRREVEQALAEMKGRAAERPNLNLLLAEEITARCFLLLDHYSAAEPEHRRLIIGAISYFVIDDDGAEDEGFATGFDDDAKVINHVLEELGIEGQFIDLR